MPESLNCVISQAIILLFLDGLHNLSKPKAALLLLLKKAATDLIPALKLSVAERQSLRVIPIEQERDA